LKLQSPEKKNLGSPRLQYLKKVARNTAAESYIAMERVACNNSGWKAVNQSKDWMTRRRRRRRRRRNKPNIQNLYSFVCRI